MFATQLDLAGVYCPIFTVTEYAQIYNHMDQVFHIPTDSLYCTLTSLYHQLQSLLTNEGRGVSIAEIPQCRF